MTLYVDSSALLKRYVAEPDSKACERILLGDPGWVTGRHTQVEVRRNLARLLSGAESVVARELFARDFARMEVIELDVATCSTAADMAEMTGARSLDALHLAAAQRAGGVALTFVTYDAKRAQAARSVGYRVAGAG